MNAIEALAKCGHAMFGREWLRKTAGLVGMSATTFSKWKNGSIKSFDSNHSIFPVLSYHMRQKATKLMDTAAEIDMWSKICAPSTQTVTPISFADSSPEREPRE